MTRYAPTYNKDVTKIHMEIVVLREELRDIGNFQHRDKGYQFQQRLSKRRISGKEAFITALRSLLWVNPGRTAGTLVVNEFLLRTPMET